MPDRAYDRSRLKNLIHYVIWAAGSRPHFGATKLYKVAWFSDARSYMLTGKSITGAKYIREKHGPIPHEGMLVRAQLEQEGLIRQSQERMFDHLIWKFKALAEPSWGVFTVEERQTIDWWVAHIADNHTADSISDESHDYAWEIAKMKEPLPFTAILSQRIRDPNNEEKSRLQQRARELGLM